MAQPQRLIVCPTSHMDWNWQRSFEEYYKTNTYRLDPNGQGQSSVQSILDAACALAADSAFCLAVAELGWLQRYRVDAPSLSASIFTLMGGAITSPDSIVCDGEVFVRAFLLGRQWARSAGLGTAIANIAWLPDDFGHDPELPLILAAMGLPAVAFARVPGAFPNYNGPLDGSSSIACALMASGVAFNWLAGDGSAVFAHFMPDQYGVPFHSQGADGSGNAAYWQQFLQSLFLSEPKQYNNLCQLSAVAWPGGIAFAPAGGDFDAPGAGWSAGVTVFNQQQSDTVASLGSFSDYVAAVQSSGAQLITRSLDPSNFWTGFFGSRPALKIHQIHASCDLVAAEAASSLLRFASFTGSAVLDALDAAIAQVWAILAPSSHHDFITGTSPDPVYKQEQLPMLALAAHLARATRRQALQLIANSIPPASIIKRRTGTVLAIHNAVGVDRGGVVELDRGSAVTFPSGPATVQSLAGGGLLVQAPTVPSLGYTSGLVTFGRRPKPPSPKVIAGDVTLDNGAIAITLSQSQLWSITSIALGSGPNLLGITPANLLQIYDDTGNIYQYGNEPGADPPGTFSPHAGALHAGRAVQTEFGPLRWRVEATLFGLNNTTFQLVYILVAGEPLVRMSATGSAPACTTVVTTFPAIATDGTTLATHLLYGTAHHWHEDTAPAYWPGPTFKATHNFLMPAADSPDAIFPLAAIYHVGMPAWACADGLLLGSLFRNTDGGGRGAQGTDSDTHTQHYALRISSAPLDPSQGSPLVEALQFATPLRAALASPANQPESPITLPSSASLARAPAPALVRLARPMGDPPSAAYTAPQARVALRLYRPDATGAQETVPLTLPVLASVSSISAALVTALEDPIPGASAIQPDGNVLPVPASSAITTVAVTAPRQIATGPQRHVRAGRRARPRKHQP